MKWYELRRWYRSPSGSGNTDICWSNSVEYLKQRADTDEAFNFAWQWDEPMRRFQSVPKVLGGVDEFIFFTIKELEEDRIVYVSALAYEIGPTEPEI